MEELNKIISENLVQLRTKSGLTQLQVAEKINYSDKSVSKWERGEAIPDVSILLELSKLYGVSLDAMVKKHEKGIKPKGKRFKLSQHTLITLISFVAVWFLATIGFAVVYGFFQIYDKAWLSFLVAVPVSALVLMILSLCWYPYWLSAIFSSIFIWTAVLAITLSVASVNMWLLYIIAIPIQLIVIFVFVLQIIISRRKKAIE